MSGATLLFPLYAFVAWTKKPLSLPLPINLTLALPVLLSLPLL